jgi:hypothetical protein
MDSTTLEAFAKELKTNIQSELTSQGWSSFEAGKVDVKVNDAETGFTITDGSGYQITEFSITAEATPSAPITGTAAGSSLALDNVAFSETRFGSENRLNHFQDFTVNLTTPGTGFEADQDHHHGQYFGRRRINFDVPKLTNFDPNGY